MKKSILNIGKALGKAEQKEINGGMPPPPPPGLCFCGLFLIDENGSDCVYRINGNTFYGVIVDDCCC